jgi:hypothetical protein
MKGAASLTCSIILRCSCDKTLALQTAMSLATQVRTRTYKLLLQHL